VHPGKFRGITSLAEITRPMLSSLSVVTMLCVCLCIRSDEIFCQMCCVVTNNPSVDSRHRAWMLHFLCAACFLPSVEVSAAGAWVAWMRQLCAFIVSPTILTSLQLMLSITIIHAFICVNRVAAWKSLLACLLTRIKLFYKQPLAWRSQHPNHPPFILVWNSWLCLKLV